MNAEALIKNMKPAVWRVRSKGDGSQGRVLDVLEDGWIVWFADDKSCHISRPDHLETLS